MRYYLDTEFNEFGGQLISIALVRDGGGELYLSTHCATPGDWVKANVLPVVDCDGAKSIHVQQDQFGAAIAAFLWGDSTPTIVADWPDDIKYFCQAVIVGPGQMVDIPRLQFEMLRVDAYPTNLPGAVQHNALWDARALRHALKQPAKAA